MIKIKLSSAQSVLLDDPGRIPQLIELMRRMPRENLNELSPLVFDVIGMKDRSLSLNTLKQIIELRPDWIDIEDDESDLGWSRDTPLYRAVALKCFPTVEFLLDAGANANVPDPQGLNTLDLVARMNTHRETARQICEALLEKREFTQPEKDCALYLAAESSNLETVIALLSHGADFTKTTKKGTALGAACFVQEPNRPVVEIVKAMLQTDRARQVIDSGWDPDGGYGAPIHCAAISGNVAVLSALAQAGASINPPSGIPKKNPVTPLMLAAINVNVDAIEFLINTGADASLVNVWQQNALHYLAQTIPDAVDASITQDLLIRAAKLLLAAGADPFQEGANGSRAQDIARENGNFSLAHYLGSITSSRDLESTTAQAPISATKSSPRI